MGASVPEELDRISLVADTFLAPQELNRQLTPLAEKPSFKDVVLGAVVSPRPGPPETDVLEGGIAVESDDDSMDNIPIAKLKLHKGKSYRVAEENALWSDGEGTSRLYTKRRKKKSIQ
ncbi:hypothetical protein U1Q18_041201 [Sarracenia purpurea var. burkii]